MTTASKYVTWARNVASDLTRRKQAIADLKTYFAKSDGVPNYTGSRFESLGGGGDRPEVANVVTAEDLLALSLLSVEVRGDAALYLLEVKASEISALLKELPTDRDLADLSADEIGDDWAARELWRAIYSAKGFGPVFTSKLLARKRPRLIPIIDRGIRHVFGSGENQWRSLNEALNTPVDGATTLQQLLVELREKSEIDEHISALRVLDVVAWMEWKRSLKETASPSVLEAIDPEPASAP